MIHGIFLILLLSSLTFCREITYDGRAFIIDQKRRLLISGSIHYPRSTPDMWPKIFKYAKEGGIDIAETYVFWNGHEELETDNNFKDNYDLVRFVREASKAGLYVIVRIGPYICGEWNYGGFPIWLKLIPNMVFRTFNEPFMAQMKRWTTKIVDLLKENNLMYPQGGPVIALQVENEYGQMESTYGENGKKYVKWAAEMARDTNAGVPWIMCIQEDAPPYIINTINGFYGDNWISKHHKKFPNQPAAFTENWPGWFQGWGGRKPIRPAEDIAFSVLRWFARGGAFMNYYMYHGGTNFGRTSGPMLTTSYDYDAPIDEFGLPNNPKYGHLQAMHEVLHKYEELIMKQDPPEPKKLDTNVEVHVYGTLSSTDCVAFISNINTEGIAKVNFNSRTYNVPAWSVTILKECKDEVYNSAIIVATPNNNPKIPFLPTTTADSSGWLQEPISGSSKKVTVNSLKEHLSLTKGTTDFLWYELTYNSA